MVIPMKQTLEQRMVFAHQEGVMLAKFCQTEQEVRKIAADRFGPGDEHDAMIAGYLGYLRRASGARL
jgi:hypothetical protein